MTSIAASTVALVVAMALFIVLSMKGYPQIPTILLCVAIVALTIENPWITTFVDTFSEGTVSTFQSSALVYLTGGGLGAVVAATGCGKAMGRFIVRHAGKRSGPILCMLLNIFVAFSGMATSVFIIISVCSAVAEEADQPLYIYLAATTGIGTIFKFSCPGFPGITNLMPTFYLGTSIYAGATIGIIGVIVGSALMIAYTFHLMKYAEKRGDHFVPTPFCDDTVLNESDMKLPSLWVAFSPVVIVIVGCYLFTEFVGISSTQSVIVCQILATVWLLAIRWKALPKGKQLQSVASGMQNAFPLVIGCAFLAGFGAVIQSTSACQAIIDRVLNWELNPYVLAFIGMLIIAALVADGVSSQVLFCTTLGETLLSTGVQTGVLHRIITMTATVTDSLPHSSMIFMQLNVFGYTHKQAYKYLFVTTVIIPLIVSGVGTAIACVFY